MRLFTRNYRIVNSDPARENAATLYIDVDDYENKFIYKYGPPVEGRIEEIFDVYDVYNRNFNGEVASNWIQNGYFYSPNCKIFSGQADGTLNPTETGKFFKTSFALLDGSRYQIGWLVRYRDLYQPDVDTNTIITWYNYNSPPPYENPSTMWHLEKITHYTLPVKANEWRILTLPFNVKVPKDVEVLHIPHDSEKTQYLQVGTVIPAEYPIIIRKKDGNKIDFETTKDMSQLQLFLSN